MKKYNFNYITTNKINGKRYVGAHKTNNINDGYMGGGRLFGKAKKKYKKENFDRKILCFTETIEEAFKNEAIFIKKYNTLAPNGYNLSPTGGTNIPNCFSKETRKKMGDKTRGKTYIELYGEERAKEISQKISKSEKGTLSLKKNKTYIELYGEERAKEIKQKMKEYIPWNKGLTKETDERIRKYSETKTGKKQSKEHIKNHAKALMGNTNVKGKITIYKDNEEKRIKEEDLQDYLNDGWKLGLTEEHKQNISKAMLSSTPRT